VSAESGALTNGRRRLFFLLSRRGFSFSEVGRRAGRGWARAAALEARTPVNPPSLTGRRPDASATSLRLVEWSLGSGRERRFGVGTRRRARTRVACFSRSVGTARRGLATARRRRKGARRVARRRRRGVRTRAIAATLWGPRVPPPSPRTPPSPTPRSRSATSRVQEHPRPRSSRSGRSRAARAREADAHTNARLRFLEGARTPRSDRSRDGRARLRPARRAQMRSAVNVFCSSKPKQVAARTRLSRRNARSGCLPIGEACASHAQSRPRS
jgi:hypothetical protein